MPTNERIILDPAEAISGRTELDISPWLGDEGIDWGDDAVEMSMAELTRGAIPIDFTIPNREVNGSFRFYQTLGGTTIYQARGNIEHKIALWQKEGGVLKRIMNNGSIVYAD